MKKLLMSLVCSLIVVSGCSSSSNETPNDVKLIQFEEVKAGDVIATMETNMGTIKFRLFPEQAPKTVENFTEHAKAGYYDGVSFHRVIKDFMIQGGDPKGTGAGGESIWGSSFNDEFSNELYNFNGALSMANAGPNTNGSQFFIVQSSNGSTLTEDYFTNIYKQAKSNKFANADFRHPENVKAKYKEVGGTPHLDQMHTVFGQVIEGMDIVNKIANVETGTNDKPVEDVLIQSITIEEAQ